MLVKCKFNTGASIPLERRRGGEGDEANFAPLLIGGDYIVYGILFAGRSVDLLVCPDGGTPMWAPSDLFEIQESSLPPWRTCFTSQNEQYRELLVDFGITALIGYDELVESFEHYIGILERESEHLEIFFSKQRFIDQWQASLLIR
jgi:hypothetical protein